MPAPPDDPPIQGEIVPEPALEIVPEAVPLKLPRPIILLSLFLGLFCGALGFGWMRQGPSNQELLANFSKAIDYFHGALSVGGWPWWTPNFMGGHTLAPTLGTVFGSFFILVGSGIAGPFAGPKLVGLIFIAASGFAMFGFARKFSGSAWTGLVCAMFYATCPQLSQRLAGSEHIVVAMCFPFPPLIMWALMAVAEVASWRNSVLLAMAVAGMCLTFDKHGVLFLPAVAVVAGWLYVTRKETRRNLRVGILRAAGSLVLLGVLPLLPAVREAQWLSLFANDPFEGWQQSFSMKTALSWFDRGGALMQGAPGNFTVEQGGFYLGAIAILAFGVLFLWRREESLQTEQGRKCRFFIGVTLFYNWLSYGPHTVFGGHLEFLSMAQSVQNWVLPICWFGLIAQVWIIIRLWPRCRWRPFRIAVALAIYLFVPGFVLLEKVPGFGQIRAPWSVWQVGGSFCLAMAAGLAVETVWNQVRLAPGNRLLGARWKRICAVALALILGLADLWAYQGDFFTGALPDGTFSDFEKAEDFLTRAPMPGRIYALSGRYFYLMTPFLSRRTLAMEAFSSYNMERWSRLVHDIAMSSPELMKAYMNVTGISYILIDKQDKDVPPQLQKNFRDTYPVAYENAHFAILKNASSLAPAFLAHEFIALPPESETLAGQMLSYARYSFLSVETPVNDSPDLAGELDEKGEIQLKPEFKEKAGSPFERVSMAPDEWGEWRRNFHRIDFQPVNETRGWLVIGESYHPDWKAYAGERQIPVRRAMGSLLAVELPETPSPIRLQFEPPFWYSGCLDVSLAAWIACMALMSVGLVAPGSWRKIWTGGIETPAGPAPVPPIPAATPAGRCVVLIPVCDEAKNLPELLERLLRGPQGLDVLIVADFPAEGTARAVREHAEFGQRLFLIESGAKAGLASACKRGFEWAAGRDYDACIEMDADLSYDPADIPRLIEALNDGAGVAIGSRYLDGIRVMNWPQGRLQLSLLARAWTRMLTGLPLTDPASGFAAMRREVIAAYDWERFVARGQAFRVELHFYAWRNGFRLREVPVVFTGHDGGGAKVPWSDTAAAAWRVVRFVPERLEPFGAARAAAKPKVQG